MKCKICKKKSDATFCELHKKAYESIIAVYDSWKNALEISWKEYLNEVIKNQYSGKWVKEVTRYILEQGDEEFV